MTYSDKELKQFIEHRLGEIKSREIEQAMRVDRALEMRILAQDTLSQDIRNAMLSIPSHDVIENMQQHIINAPIEKSWVQQMLQTTAILLVGVVIGTGTMMLLSSGKQSDWRAKVAQYQSLYVPDTITGTNFNTETLHNQIARAEAKLEHSLDGEQLMSIGTLSLARTQILSIDEAPLIQIAYRGPDDRPFALCIMPNTSTEESSQFLSENIHKIATVSWHEDGFQYILLGGSDADFLMQHAQIARAKL